MTSRRKVAKKVEELEEESDHSPEDTIVMCLVSLPHNTQWPGKEAAKYPEYVVKPHPEKRPKVWNYATPHLIPEKYLQDSFLIICTEENHDKHGLDPAGENNTVTVRTLWESLSEADLQQEYEYRKENGESIPDILARYE